MNINWSAITTIKNRHSVRTFSTQPVATEQQTQLEEFVKTLDNPFHQPVHFHYLNRTDTLGAQKLGTYGIIKGSKHFMGATIEQDGLNLEALGFEFECAILYLTHLGLGSCWMGGTFDRQGFAGAMAIKQGELFPIISPYGYPADKPHLTEKAMRLLVRADSRKDPTSLFFYEDFNTPLTKEKAGPWSVPLEMVRLAPSASNKQPWRVLLRGGFLHFYEAQSPGYSSAFSFDIQRIDLGIAAAHFFLAAQELNLPGRFDQRRPPLDLPENYFYRFSWVPD